MSVNDVEGGKETVFERNQRIKAMFLEANKRYVYQGGSGAQADSQGDESMIREGLAVEFDKNPPLVRLHPKVEKFNQRVVDGVSFRDYMDALAK